MSWFATMVTARAGSFLTRVLSKIFDMSNVFPALLASEKLRCNGASKRATSPLVTEMKWWSASIS
ncbi:hypothetical protein D3C87_2200580 [compost metagenome]